MAHFYLSELLSQSALVEGAQVLIDGEEARHAVRVSRLRVGESILIGDGAGTVASCEVTSTSRDEFRARVLESRHVAEQFPRLVLVQALAKGGRDERAVETATEYGVDAIVPWQAERSVSRWQLTGSGQGPNESKGEKGHAKWVRVAREATKQSLRARVPQLRPFVHLEELVRSALDERVCVLVLHPAGVESLAEFSGRVNLSELAEISVIVGPEGGITDAELQRLQEAGAHVVRLGDTVLRTSSAGPAALAVLNAALGRW